jgi:alanyl-tRNA synthetase
MPDLIDLTQDLPWEYFSRTGLIRPEQVTEWNQFRTAARHFATLTVNAVFKHLLNKLSRYKTERNTARTEVAKRQTRIDRLIDECDKLSHTIVRITVKQRGSLALAGPKRSAKINDPKHLTDDKEPKYKHWLLHICNKLRENADYFLIESSKITYIKNRTNNKTACYITSCIRPKHPE